MTKTDFATLIGMTQRRVNQLIDEGTVVVRGKQIDAVASLVALLKAEKRKNLNRDARASLTLQQVRGAELRGQRMLKKYLSVDEFEDVLRVMINESHDLAQNCSARLYYYTLADKGDDQFARKAAGDVLKYMREATRLFGDAGASLCANIRSDMLQNSDRIAREFEKLVKSPTLLAAEPVQ